MGRPGLHTAAMMEAGRTHFEPFLHLAGLGDTEALIAWGGFYFRRASEDARWELADDEALTDIAEAPRTETIGARSEPYGRAIVEVLRGGRVIACEDTSDANHLWVRGLEPDTDYEYRVVVDGSPWAEGERQDWDPDARTLRARGRYDNRFRTFPAEDTAAPLTFAVIGDFGVGILRETAESARQASIARLLQRLVDAHDVRLVITVGDNIYLGEGQTTTGSGDEDDDWYASFYQPYRYALNRVPFFPSVGNHDAADTEQSDDREQLADNYFTEHRFRPEVVADRASREPGLFYRLGFGSDVDFVAIDTSFASDMPYEHYFDDPGHAEWLTGSFEQSNARWVVPFSHHPPFCAGPEHGNTTGMVERLVPLFERSNVSLVLSGHEHNFQHSVLNGIHYFISGAGAKLRPEPPTQFVDAHTNSWASEGHLLLIRINADHASVSALGDLTADGSLVPIRRKRADGKELRGPITISRR